MQFVPQGTVEGLLLHLAPSQAGVEVWKLEVDFLQLFAALLDLFFLQLVFLIEEFLQIALELVFLLLVVNGLPPRVVVENRNQTLELHVRGNEVLLNQHFPKGLFGLAFLLEDVFVELLFLGIDELLEVLLALLVRDHLPKRLVVLNRSVELAPFGGVVYSVLFEELDHELSFFLF